MLSTTANAAAAPATLLPGGALPVPQWQWAFVGPAAVAGAAAAFGLGMDFPFSTRRFSRLAA